VSIVAEKKEKQYVSDNARLMAEWNWEKNSEIALDPCKLTTGSHKYASWICASHKTKFEQEIRARTKGERKCPQCYDEWRTSIDRERYIKGKKVLAETHPHLVEEWVSCDDSKFTPYTCVAGSNVKVKWKCQTCGGEYEAYVANRALRGSSCPYCAGQKVLIGYNDLQSQSSELAVEWSKKNIIKPTEVTLHSNKKVYWVCPLGHDDYLMSIKQRSNRQGCPICAQQSQTSFPEQAIYFYFKQAFNDTVNRYIFEGQEIDIFIPSKNIGIEYNGYYFHKEKSEKDIHKKEFLKSVGITLFVIKEYKRTEEKNQADFYIHERTSFNDLTRLVRDLLRSICSDVSIDIDCLRDSIAIKNQYVILRKENSIAAVRPELVERWDYEKNGSITPEMVTLGTGQRFYWKCKICNRSYLALPSKIAEGSVCSKHRNLLKYDGNDLVTKHPELLKYWDYEKNDVNPSEIFGGGERVVYWKCEKGHSYTKSILKRVRGEGCPICAGKKVLVGFNDLSTVCLDVAKTWNYPKNGDVLPVHITAHSNKKFWWICEHGHEWEAKVCNRVNGRGCPECAKQKRNKKNI
jgi:DNA-directed RNA polymerase subunit RPC12/RpoP